VVPELDAPKSPPPPKPNPGGVVLPAGVEEPNNEPDDAPTENDVGVLCEEAPNPVKPDIVSVVSRMLLLLQCASDRVVQQQEALILVKNSYGSAQSRMWTRLKPQTPNPKTPNPQTPKTQTPEPGFFEKFSRRITK
jgi:hypothetical protein